MVIMGVFSLALWERMVGDAENKTLALRERVG